MSRRPLILSLTTAAGALWGACSSPEPNHAETASPLLEVSDAYELAGLETLPEVAPDASEGLHNLYHLSDSIISGSEPHGEEAFAELARLGVKTILSVDGKVPEAETAARHGLRYVHVPIRYNGIEDEELLQITKTFRELPGPFYVHCFHGKHRGPAAAAVGRVVLDGAERERVVAEMRQWCGTSKQYGGLFSTLASKPIPTLEQTSAYAFDFPAARPMQGFRQAMVEIPRLHDNLELLADNGWRVDPAHPDLEPLNEAQNLLEIFRQAAQLEEVAAHAADFRGWLSASIDANAELVTALEALAREPRTTAREAAALAAFEDVQAQCTACHRAYRNRP
jgi:protein tyrosine phosphatase (PTP) superfamily phosphohydrolase (DUF442 family)